MQIRARVFGVAAVLLLMSFLTLSAQDKNSSRGRQLPANWAKLGLSAEQKSKVYEVQEKYKSQIEALQKQINDLRKKERSDMEGVLTDGQKTRLREILLEKAPGSKPEKTDKKPNDK